MEKSELRAIKKFISEKFNTMDISEINYHAQIGNSVEIDFKMDGQKKRLATTYKDLFLFLAKIS